MTSVYFVRHAQTDIAWEEDRTRPLTAEGKMDVRKVFEFFKNVPIDGFYCSPYKRSIDTIKSTVLFHKKTIEIDERLRERKQGPKGNSLTMFQNRWDDMDYHEKAGESLRMVQDRNIAALLDILSKNKDKTIIVGTHGTALSTILHYFDPKFNYDSFMRIINWTPYVVELGFEGNTYIGKKEHFYTEKVFQS